MEDCNSRISEWKDSSIQWSGEAPIGTKIRVGSAALPFPPHALMRLLQMRVGNNNTSTLRWSFILFLTALKVGR